MVLPHLDAAFDTLVRGNAAVSVTVVSANGSAYKRASGRTLGGQPVTASTPMVLASVSKLITSLTIARLVEAGRLTLDARVPWTAMGLQHDPAWDGVTVRELLDHTSGMPIARDSWFDLAGPCSIPLEEALAQPPRPQRGKWAYSNGNYCALGLLISYVTSERLDSAARQLVLAGLHAGDAHLTTDQPLASDGPYAKGVARLERLGGAGTWMASSDIIATIVAAATDADMTTLAYPAVMTDQYGWGHTGTVDGAKACAWRLSGDTTIVAIVAGNRPDSGGRLCDLLVPALAADFGITLGKPDRQPK